MRLFHQDPNSKLDLHPAQDDAALRATCDAVAGGDWTAARDLLAAHRTDFDRRARHLWVLAESVTNVWWATGGAAGRRPRRQRLEVSDAWPDRWCLDEPDNPDAVLMRARSLIARAWEVRGSGWAKSVGAGRFEEFHQTLLMAVPLCHRAARLAPQDPTPWAVLLLLITALGGSRSDFDRCWAEVIARDPFHREAHNFRLMYLCQKWRGSHQEMFAFARSVAAAAPPGSPLHILPVQANAEWGLWVLDREGIRAGQHVYRTWLQNPIYHAELDNALRRWFDVADRRHAMWYHDLNFLAYGLYRANRHAQARTVFEAIGPYAEEIPWIWDVHQDGAVAFRAARRRARNA